MPEGVKKKREKLRLTTDMGGARDALYRPDKQFLLSRKKEAPPKKLSLQTN